MAVSTTNKNDDWVVSFIIWMKKLIIGIKENDKIIFLRTEEFNDEFDCQKLVKVIKTVVDIFGKREGGSNEQKNNELNLNKETRILGH